MSALPQSAVTGHGVHPERLAAALALLVAPPPLEARTGERITVQGSEVVHASRRRPVVRWRVSFHTDRGEVVSGTLIGKGYNNGGGEQAARLLASLRGAGLDDPAFAVPRPLGWDPGRRLLVQEEAPTGTLHALLEAGSFDNELAPRRVGHWLARLHATELDIPPLPVDFEKHKLEEYAAGLMTVLPGAAYRVTELVKGTEAALGAIALPDVVTHGDFQPKNVHLDADRVVVIDFDRAARAPAARDVGHFIGQTRTMGAAHHGGLDVATPWIDAFVTGYLCAGGSSEAVAAAPAYVARTFAEVLFYRLVVRPVARTEFVPSWLDAWEGCLTGGGPEP